MFMIISPDDSQVFEMRAPGFKDEINYIHELIAYSSLDVVENMEWNNKDTFLKKIDDFNKYIIHCYVTAGRMRFIFIHENTSEQKISEFFTDVYEHYTKALLNPFVDKNSKLDSINFKNSVYESMKKNFGVF